MTLGATFLSLAPGQDVPCVIGPNGPGPGGIADV